MKYELNGAAITRLAGMCVLVIATLASPEALAQGGRAAQGRSSTGVEVQRKGVVRQKAASSKKKTVARKPATRIARRARVVEAAVPDKPKATSRSAGRTVQRGAAISNNGRNRDSQVRPVERGVNRSARGTSTVTTRDRTRIESADRRTRELRNNRAVRDRPSDRGSRRSRYTGPRYNGAKSVRHLYTKRDRFYFHNRRHRPEFGWCTAYHPAGHAHYVDARIHIGSHLYLGVSWPWAVRYRTHWHPRFRYRQVVYVETVWGGRRIRNRVEVHTYYRHRILFADDRYSEVEIEVDAIDLYQNGQFLATVDRIPGSLSKVRALIHADGRIEFDRNLFVMGDTNSGFELIATRYYTDHLYNAYDPVDGFKVGRVNLRNGRVRNVSTSRFFDGGRFRGYAPISLLPEDDRLWDLGRPVSYRYEDSGLDSGWYRGYRGVDAPSYGGEYELSRGFLDSYSTADGGDVRLERATVLDRLD